MKSQLPPAPEHLSAEAKRLWKRFVMEWEFSQDALLLLEGALEAFDTMRQAQALLRKDGLTIKDRFGQAKVHPATLIERDAKGTLLRYLKTLGLDLEPVQGIGRPPKQGGPKPTPDRLEANHHAY